MRLVFTEQAQQSMNDSFLFLLEEQGIPSQKIDEFRDNIKLSSSQLLKNPYLGQREPRLQHLNKEHRRLTEGYFKIIYFVHADSIYITDIFDTRQDPTKMKG
jgi:toxin ParE1/3/4